MKGLLFVLFVMTASLSFAADPVFVDSYEEAVASERSVLVVFGTDWCENCVKLKKDINKINLDDYVVCILNADVEKELSNSHGVRAYPTSLVFKKGKEVSRKVGYRKFEFERWINQNR